MADRRPKQPKAMAPRFGRRVERPRCEHAQEASEKASALLNDIDRLLGSGPDV